MSEPDTQTFRLLDPDGKEIMTGSMNALLEHLPDTKARNQAIDSMLKTAIESLEAERTRDQAREASVRMLCDSIDRLCSRLDSYEEQRAQSIARAEEEQQRRDQEEVQAYLDKLPNPEEPNEYSFDRKERETTDQDLPPPKDPTGVSVDQDPAPQDPNLMGTNYDPEPAPAPGSRLYPPHPGIPQPVSISLNSEGV
jgi:hypothetical protein